MRSTRDTCAFPFSQWHFLTAYPRGQPPHHGFRFSVLCVLDVYGLPGKTTSLLSGMCSLVVSESLCISLLQVFLSQGVGMGIGQGILFLPSLTIVGHHFKRRRALASGIVVSGGMSSPKSL